MIVKHGGSLTPCFRVPQLKFRQPFVERCVKYFLEPWGLPTLRFFVKSSHEESMACASCVHRLWLLHRDYYFHVTGVGEQVGGMGNEANLGEINYTISLPPFGL